MSRFTKWAIVPAIAVAMVLTTDATKADAGGFSISIGSGGFGSGGLGYGGYGYGGSSARYGSGYRGYGGGISSFNYGSRSLGPVVYPGVSTRYGVGYQGYAQPRYQYRAPVAAPYRGGYHHQPRPYDCYRGY